MDSLILYRCGLCGDTLRQQFPPSLAEQIRKLIAQEQEHQPHLAIESPHILDQVPDHVNLYIVLHYL
ncbi:MAG TPA: hypothetical protein VFE58_07355 [Tepidisphaeraceae bacterium]|nr:hypothetical protein [Tepidisphaeraceae bacterium]